MNSVSPFSFSHHIKLSETLLVELVLTITERKTGIRYYFHIKRIYDVLKIKFYNWCIGYVLCVYLQLEMLSYLMFKKGKTSFRYSSVQFIHSVVSDSLWPHEPQHTRLPCPSPTPGVHPNPCPLSQWCHPAISSSVIPFSSSPQSFPASGSFPMSQLFTSGGLLGTFSV